MARAWAATVVLFVAGAVLAVWGNQIAEHVDWDIPDGLYPALGILLLIAGVVWMWMVNDAARIRKPLYSDLKGGSLRVLNSSD